MRSPLQLAFVTSGLMRRSEKSSETVRPAGVIFDVDGTLVDSFDLGFSSTNAVLLNNGYSAVTEEDYVYGCRFATPERLAWHTGLAESEAQEVGAQLGAEFDGYYVKLVTRESAPLVEGMTDLLTKLDHVKLGCLTNAAVAYAEAVLETHGLRSKFLTVRGADDVPNPKPHPDGLLVCCDDLNLRPEDCVYIGDSVTDGKAAQNANFKRSIGVAWASLAFGNSETKLRDSGNFDTVVTTLPQLEQCLLQCF